MKRYICLLAGGLAILASVAVLLIAKHRATPAIEHFRQYFYPCAGQAAVFRDKPSSLRFAFLDEEELSEIALPENLHSVTLRTADGGALPCEDWSVTELQTMSARYRIRSLTVTATFSGDTEITGIVLTYPDGPEEFSLGSLSVRTFLPDVYLSYLTLYGSLESAPKNGGLPTQACGHRFLPPTYLEILYSCQYPAVTILRIELGIPGLFVLPGTGILLPDSVGSISGFWREEGHSVYAKEELLPEPPTGDLALTLEQQEGGSIGYALFAVGRTADYPETPVSFYLSPVFTCVDEETGEEFLCAAVGSFILQYPQPLSEDAALALLEEQGK